MLFLGRPLRFFGGTSVSTSAAFESAAPASASRDFDLAALLTGVPLRFTGVAFRLTFDATPMSDFLGLPRGRLTGEDASGSFNGTVVVLVRVTRLILGDCAFSSSVPGSASTVTLMRQGLAPLFRGVFMTSDLEGDENSNSDTLDPRFCLLGEVAANGVRRGALRDALGLLSMALKEEANGSGLDS